MEFARAYRFHFTRLLRVARSHLAAVNVEAAVLKLHTVLWHGKSGSGLAAR